jgi:cytochrome c-type biogenesis protein CcmE
MNVRFVITDTARDMTVCYTGILAHLFKQGKGAVAQSRLGAHGEFIAAEVLTKLTGQARPLPPAAPMWP